MKKITINKNIFIITYKLLYDLLFLTIISFTFFLIAESALPGFISSYISASKIILLLVIIIFSLLLLGKKINIEFNKKDIKKDILVPLLTIFSFIIIGSSMLKFSLWQNIIITIISLFIIYLFYDLIFYYED